MFAARAASACHWSWTAVGDDQRPTEGDSRLRGTWELLQRETDEPRNLEHNALTDWQQLQLS